MKKLLALLIGLSLTSPLDAQTRRLPVVRPITKTLTINGKTLDQLRSKMPKSSSISHTIWTYSSWTCEAGNWQTCDGHITFSSPAGFQICKVSKSESNMSGRDRWSKFEPTSFYPNDPEDPDRFRSTELYVHAGGDHQLVGNGSSITVVFVIDTIAASANDYTRYLEGCQMPAHNGK